ncbi:MAG: hypothetical protein QG670_2353, partial [Thermoproteota archaeon]|nr:hypothetical protein [Thermoproteota archaeon]
MILKSSFDFSSEYNFSALEIAGFRAIALYAPFRLRVSFFRLNDDPVRLVKDFFFNSTTANVRLMIRSVTPIVVGNAGMAV